MATCYTPGSHALNACGRRSRAALASGVCGALRLVIGRHNNVGVSLRERRDTNKVMLGVSLWARWDATLEYYVSLSFMLSARFFYLCGQHHKDDSIGAPSARLRLGVCVWRHLLNMVQVSRVPIQDIALKLCITQNKHGMLSPAHEYTSSQTLHTFKVCGGLPTRIAIANHRRNVVNMQDSNGTMGICKHIELHRRGLAKFEGSIALD